MVFSLYSMRYWDGSALVGRKIAPPVWSGTFSTATCPRPCAWVLIDGGASMTPFLSQSRAESEAVSQPSRPTRNSLR